MKKKAIKIISIILAAVLIIGAGVLGGWGIYNMPKTVKPEIKGEVIDTLGVGDYKISACKDGTFSALKNDEVLFANATCEYKLGDEIISSTDYDDILISYDIAEYIWDKNISIIMKKDGYPTVEQNFQFDERNLNYFILQTLVYYESGVTSSDYIAPLVIKNGNIKNGKSKWTRFLEVPFDNDGWVKFETKTLNESGKAYEVGALFDTESKSGFIVGSVNHDNWKSAVEMNAKAGKVTELKAYSGATDPRHGDEPHGVVTSENNGVLRAKFMVGEYDDWQIGMEDFAEANLKKQPKYSNEDEHSFTPIGWNSWGSVQQDLNYETAIGISDYVKDNFQDAWGDAVYINLDSYWDNLTDDELKAFVEHCKANGQKAGIYIAPYVMWGDEEWQKNNCVPGTDVKYYDLRLKKKNGTLYGNDFDGCYPMDVTHPATRLHIKSIADRFKAAGFEYIKLDFLVHSSFEGDFYDESITTGIQAYNYGMKYIDELFGDSMYINLAMSPIFPYQYANGRRLACDSYYKTYETEYTLNALTYGFWQRPLYNNLDPDHILVWGKDGDATEEEAIMRVTSGIVSSSLLFGDNFVNPSGDKAQAQKDLMSFLLMKKSLIFRSGLHSALCLLMTAQRLQMFIC